MIENINVPRFVSYWYKKNLCENWWKRISMWETKSFIPEDDKDVYAWYSAGNQNDFIVAWITGNYKVCSEPLYRIHFKNGWYAQRFDENTIDSCLTNEKDLAAKFTESEIKNLHNGFMFWLNFSEEVRDSI